MPIRTPRRILLGVEPLEERIAPAYLDVMVTSASVSATGAGSNGATDLRLPPHPAGQTATAAVIAQTTTPSVSTRAAVQLTGDVSYTVGLEVLLHQEGMNSASNPYVPVAQAGSAMAEVRVRIVPDDATEQGKSIVLGISSISSFTTAWGGAQYDLVQITYSSVVESGTLMSYSGSILPRSLITRDLTTAVGEEWTFRCILSARSQSAFGIPSTSGQLYRVYQSVSDGLALGLDLKGAVIDSMAVGRDIPIEGVPDIVWPGPKPPKPGPSGLSIADRTPGTVNNPATLNPDGIELRPQFVKKSQLPVGADRVRVEREVYRVLRDDWVPESSPVYREDPDIRLVSALTSATSSLDVRYAVRTPDEVGRFLLKVKFTVLSAWGQELVTQETSHRWYVTYADPLGLYAKSPELPKEQFLEKATAWASHSRTRSEVMGTLRQLVHAQPWIYSNHDKVDSAETILVGGVNTRVNCEGYAITLGYLAGLQGIETKVYYTDRRSGNDFPQGLITLPGLKGRNGTMPDQTGNAYPIGGNKDTDRDRWKFAWHSLTQWIDVDGTKYLSDATFDTSFSYDDRLKPSISGMVALTRGWFQSNYESEEYPNGERVIVYRGRGVRHDATYPNGLQIYKVLPAASPPLPHRLPKAPAIQSPSRACPRASMRTAMGDSRPSSSRPRLTGQLAP
ncbi:MAG: hypothetical protein U0840_18305 [Gemmataceae bacterium]